MTACIQNRSTRPSVRHPIVRIFTGGAGTFRGGTLQCITQVFALSGHPRILKKINNLCPISTVSSGLNSLAAVTLEDFIRPLASPGMSDAAATRISKSLSIFYGLVAYGLVYLMANLNHLVEVSLVVS